MVSIELFVLDLVLGLLLGGVLATLAYGLNLIWGVLGIVNVAHGEFIMLGAYIAYFLNLFYGMNPLISVPVDAVVGFGMGYLLYYSVFHHQLKGKETVSSDVEVSTLLATFGLSLFGANLAAFAFTPNDVGINWSAGFFNIGFIRLSVASLFDGAIAIAIMLIVHAYLTRTYTGTAIRGFMQDVTAIKLMGINPIGIVSLATAIGIGLAMMGGALITVYASGGINPYFGDYYAFVCFVIIVLGGKGKMVGTFVGALIIGVVTDVAQLFVPLNVAQAIAFLILIPTLLIVPEGIAR